MVCIMTRDELVADIRKEGEICKHLFTKIPEGAADYRPSPKQRSMIELMRYLVICAIAPVRALIADDWTAARDIWGRAADMPFEDFPAEIDRQTAEVVEAIMAVPDADFNGRTVKFVTGDMHSLGYGLVRGPMKWITSYRMQLFLYIKAAGAEDIGTANNWNGIDWPAKAPAEVVEE